MRAIARTFAIASRNRSKRFEPADDWQQCLGSYFVFALSRMVPYLCGLGGLHLPPDGVCFVSTVGSKERATYLLRSQDHGEDSTTLAPKQSSSEAGRTPRGAHPHGLQQLTHADCTASECPLCAPMSTDWMHHLCTERRLQGPVERSHQLVLFWFLDLDSSLDLVSIVCGTTRARCPVVWMKLKGHAV